MISSAEKSETKIREETPAEQLTRTIRDEIQAEAREEETDRRRVGRGEGSGREGREDLRESMGG